jgi:hypothetical protein
MPCASREAGSHAAGGKTKGGPQAAFAPETEDQKRYINPVFTRKLFLSVTPLKRSSIQSN